MSERKSRILPDGVSLHVTRLTLGIVGRLEAAPRVAGHHAPVLGCSRLLRVCMAS